jgi:3-hydroxy-D-aspartate aldolase
MNDMTPFHRASKSATTSPPCPAWPRRDPDALPVLDLDALERNIKKMGDYAKAHGMRHRVHGKMHKSVDVAKLQVELGGACGVCCQKVSEAEVFARGGIKDVLVSNQVRDPAKIDRLARMPKLGARTICCVDDVDNVADLSAAAQKHGTEIECLVEIDCGAGRCGVTTTPEVVEIAKAIDAAPGLKFAGIQAYQGAMQHMDSYDDRKAKIDIAVAMVKDAVDTLKAEGLDCDIVGGGGTGSYYFESTSGVYNELQCGSYAFMDADYGRILDKDGNRIDQGEWENALFILTERDEPRQGRQGHRRCGPQGAVGRQRPAGDLRADGCRIREMLGRAWRGRRPDGVLKVNDKLRLVPGHCDPTCNVHDWYVGVRGGVVETVWPVSARGKAY